MRAEKRAGKASDMLISLPTISADFLSLNSRFNCPHVRYLKQPYLFQDEIPQSRSKAAIKDPSTHKDTRSSELPISVKNTQSHPMAQARNVRFILDPSHPHPRVQSTASSAFSNHYQPCQFPLQVTGISNGLTTTVP